MKVSKYSKKNWVLYIEQLNTKKATKYDILLDKVLDIAKPLGSLYEVSSLDVYCSDLNIHVEYIFDKRHLFINMIPIDEVKDLTDKLCTIILDKLIKGLNQAKLKIQEINA